MVSMRLAERCAAVALFLGSMVWLPMSQAKLMLSLPLASSSGCQMALGPWNSRAIHSNSTHPSKTGRRCHRFTSIRRGLEAFGSLQ